MKLTESLKRYLDTLGIACDDGFEFKTTEVDF